MFSKSICRAAAPLRRTTSQRIRSYATQPTSASGLGPTAYAAIAAAVGGGGYYYYTSVQGTAPPTPQIPAPSSSKQTLGSSDAVTKAFTGGDQGFIALKLDKVEEINHNTKKFIFALPEADQVSGLPIASALLTRFQAEGMEKPVIRPYTPTSDEDEQGFLELIIKKYPGGPMSEHLHSMKTGQSLEIKGPIPKYQMTANKHDHIAMICGGTGITPMYQVARGIFNNPEDKTKVTLVFGNVTEQDILLKDKFNELENTYPQRFKVFYVLDKPPAKWTSGSGLINKDLLQTVLPEPKTPNFKILVCGPPGLYKAVSGVKKSPSDQGELDGSLKELGYTKDQVYKF